MSALGAGDALPELHITSVSAEAMKTMAVILDDPNLIHLDADVVKALGLGDRVINQGPTNSGYVMNMLLAAFPGARLSAFTVRFLSNVLGGDSVTAGGTVESIDGSIVNCSVWLTVEPDRPAIVGEATLQLSR